MHEAAAGGGCAPQSFIGMNRVTPLDLGMTREGRAAQRAA
jgi:hypothetical protein